MQALLNFFHNRVSQITFINDEQTLFSHMYLCQPLELAEQGDFPGKGTRGTRAVALKLGIEHRHFSARAEICTTHSLQPIHFSLLLQAIIPPFPAFNPPQEEPTQPTAVLPPCCSLELKPFPTSEHSTPSFPPSQGPAAFRRQRIFPPETRRQNFSSTGTLGQGPLRGNISPPILSQAGSGTRQNIMVTVSSRRGREAQTAALQDFWWYRCYFLN